MKKITLPNAKGLQFSPLDTLQVLELLYRVGCEETTDNDPALARSILMRVALLTPEYANQKPVVRPALSPIRHTKKRR